MAIERFELDLDQDPTGITVDLLLIVSAAFHARFGGNQARWEAAMTDFARMIDRHVDDQHLLDPDPTHAAPDTPQ